MWQVPTTRQRRHGHYVKADWQGRGAIVRIAKNKLTKLADVFILDKLQCADLRIQMSQPPTSTLAARDR